MHEISVLKNSREDMPRLSVNLLLSFRIQSLGATAGKICKKELGGGLV